jgi:anti-sigma B factor antagonist
VQIRIHTIRAIRMGDEPRSEQPAVDARGIRPPDVFTIEAREAPHGVAVLALTGEFDLAAAPALREELALARTAGARGVVLDMAEVTFVDSSALRELLRADAALRADGVPFVLAALGPPIDRLLELTRTAGMLTASPTLEAALRRLTRQ